MGTTIVKENYPEAPGSIGLSGKEEVVFVNYGTGATPQNPVWSLVGGVVENSLNINLEVKTVNTKDTKYWANGGIVGKSGELSASIVYEEEDVGQEVIDNFIMDDETTEEKKALQFAIVNLKTLKYKKFWAAPTSWENQANSEDLIQKSLSATVLGKVEKLSGFVVPGSNASLDPVTFSKAAAADVVLSVPSGTITSLKKGNAYVTATNYSIALGGKSIVILDSYLDDLDNGEHVFHLILADGADVSCVITVTA